MKSYLTTAMLLGVFFISCKKDRVCNCTVATTGTTKTHSQSSAISFSLNLGLPIPIPPIDITQARDTTIDAPFSYSDTHKVNYEKVSKKTMHKVCPASFEETFTDGSITIIPGTSTVTTTETGKKVYTCKIE